jgi:hypothetical protein
MPFSIPKPKKKQEAPAPQNVPLSTPATQQSQKAFPSGPNAAPNLITRQQKFGFRGPDTTKRTKENDQDQKVNVGKFEREILKGNLLWTRKRLEAAKNFLHEKEGEWLIDWTDYRTSNMVINDNMVPREPPTHKSMQRGVHDIERVRKVLQRTVGQWEACRMRADLIKLTRDFATKMPKVNKIVCFGLGSFSRQYGSCYCEKSVVNNEMMLQHLTALTIAETLEEVYVDKAISDHRIAIILQDPEYTDIDVPLFSELSDRFSIVEDPDGFLVIDQNTFVIHFCCPVPIYEIVADLTAAGECGKGPAGVLGNEMIVKGPAEWASAIDWETPRVLKFLKNYEMRDFDDFKLTEEEITALWGTFPWFWLSQIYFRKN